MATTMVMGMTEATAGAVNSTPTFVERRRSKRYQFTATAELVDLTSGARMDARTADLSCGGCYVDTMSPFPAQTRVKMRLTKSNRSFEVEAKVVYSLAGMGMGLAFIGADAKQVAVLKRWIGELSGELLPELSTPEPAQPVSPAQKDPREVLRDLVTELVRQGVLSPEKGKDLCDQLPRVN